MAELSPQNHALVKRLTSVADPNERRRWSVNTLNLLLDAAREEGRLAGPTTQAFRVYTETSSESLYPDGPNLPFRDNCYCMSPRCECNGPFQERPREGYFK